MSLAFKRRVKKPLSSSDRAFTNAHRTFRKVVVFFFLFIGLFGGIVSRGSLLLLPIYASFLSRRSQSVRVTQKWKSESSCPANVNSESVAALAFAVYTRNSSGETNEWPGPGGVNGWQTSIFLGFLSTVHSNFVALFNNRRSESYRRMEMERLFGQIAGNSAN